MRKKILLYVTIVALFDLLIYQCTTICSNVYAQEPKITYKQQLGSKGSENGQFRSPHSLAIDRFGNIYVGDTGNKHIEKFYPNGTFVTSWGSPMIIFKSDYVTYDFKNLSVREIAPPK